MADVTEAPETTEATYIKDEEKTDEAVDEAAAAPKIELEDNGIESEEDNGGEDTDDEQEEAYAKERYRFKFF